MWHRNYYQRETRIARPERVVPGSVVQMADEYYFITPSGGWQKATQKQIDAEANMRAIEHASKLASEEPCISS